MNAFLRSKLSPTLFHLANLNCPAAFGVMGYTDMPLFKKYWLNAVLSGNLGNSDSDGIRGPFRTKATGVPTGMACGVSARLVAGVAHKRGKKRELATSRGQRPNQ